MEARTQAPTGSAGARGRQLKLKAIAERGWMLAGRMLQVVRAWRLLALAGPGVGMFLATAHAGGDTGIGPKSGLPVPRFVSLKPDRVNVRGGPTRDHEVAFVYTRAGLPVEI